MSNPESEQRGESDQETTLMESHLDRVLEATSARNYVPKMELTSKQQRSLQDIRKRLRDEARMMGEAAYYGWGAGKDKIEGASVKLAMAAVRCWGNCSVEAMPLQETRDAYVFTSRFIDLETGYTLERQFRQSKNWMVYGKHDPERKADIRFQIGQSKAARNLVLNALPEWLIDEALEEAKAGCREKIERYVESNGLPAAVDAILRSLTKEGVTEIAVLAKLNIAKKDAIMVDDIVMLRGCLKAIQDGAERSESLFPIGAPESTTAGIEDAGKSKSQRTAEKLKAAKGAAKQPDADPEPAPDAERQAKVRENLKKAIDKAFQEPPLQRDAALHALQDDYAHPENTVFSQDDIDWANDYIANLKKKGSKS